MYTIYIYPLICENCGKKHYGEFTNRRFCSSECSVDYAIEQMKKANLFEENISPSMKGSTAESSVKKKFAQYNIQTLTPDLNSGVNLLVKINKKRIPIQVIGSTEVHGKYNNIVRFRVSRDKINNDESTPKIRYLALCDIKADEVYLIKNKNLEDSLFLHRNIPEDNNNPSYLYCDDYKFDNVIHDFIDDVINEY